MRILVVGSGGREHALLWRLARDAPDAEFFATRPNAGMATLAAPVPIAPTDIEALAGWAAARSIDLTVIGPEAPLAMGVGDRFRRAGLPVFGPTREAARIESSKAYAKDLMRRAGVPTAGFRTFTDLEGAAEHIRATGAPIVVKASGLAAGKGAMVCATVAEALAAAQQMLGELRFGEAGREIVIEEFMEGEELSVFAIADGRDVVMLLPSQDHKRVGEGDSGPNTGGMGAYAPVGIATPELLESVRDSILLPTLSALAEDGCPFQGLLYAGLMVGPGGPRVVEFNARFGDPETQVVLPLMSSPLLPLLQTVALDGSLAGVVPEWSEGAAVTTVIASEGYPGPYEKGRPIRIPEELAHDPDLVVFHAGTDDGEGGLRSAGGRVLAVTGLGRTLQDAAERSLNGAHSIDFEGSFFRSDIGWREFARAEATRP